MKYQEFTLTVPIWDISGETGETNSAKIEAIFDLLNVKLPETSFSDIYDSYYDYSVAKYSGDPSGRIGRGDVHMYLSILEDKVFIAIDMFNEVTDQMSTVSINVCAPARQANDVCKIMQLIRSSAEVASALMQGNLGVRKSLALWKFPRRVQNGMANVFQNIHVFKDGKLLRSTDAR